MKYEFKDILKELRLEKNIEQKDLAKHLNVSNSTISGWEVGRNQPSFEILMKLALFFNVSTDYLLGFEDYDYNFEYQHDNTKLIHKEKNNKK